METKYCGQEYKIEISNTVTIINEFTEESITIDYETYDALCSYHKEYGLVPSYTAVKAYMKGCLE
jgi:hypothetical protein